MVLAPKYLVSQTNYAKPKQNILREGKDQVDLSFFKTWWKESDLKYWSMNVSLDHSFKSLKF